MDHLHFDRLTRAFAGTRSRRGLLRLLAFLPLFAGLNAFDAGDTSAGRRHRRKARHRSRQEHRKRRRCQPKSKGQTCAGQCGKVKDNCRKTIDCGPCNCPSPCPTCQTCNTRNGQCIPDSTQLGTVCGDPNLVCHGDGSCAACDVCSSGCTFTTIQAAINAADNGATIHICPGTFTETISIEGNLTLVGAGDGAGAGNTILDGNQNGTVVTIAEGPTVTLQGMRITNGEATTAGGIVNQGTLTLTACTVAGNDAVEGGGIYNLGGSLILNQSSVTGNDANQEGGGIHNDNGSLILNNSQISGNTAGTYGGGILNNSATTTLNNSQVTGNTAATSGTGDGGGIFNEIGTVTLNSGSSVTNNDPDNCAGEAVSGCSG